MGRNEVTPNTTEDSNDAIAKEREGRWGVTSTPAQLTSSHGVEPKSDQGRDIRVDRDIKEHSILW
jgi:hypothetical protein